MVCTTTSGSRAHRRGFSLVELLVATAVGGVVVVAVMTLMFYSARSFSAMTNYVDLDNTSRNALDIMLREIRQADSLASGDNHQLVFNFTDPNTAAKYTVGYVYSPDSRTLQRVQAGVRTVMLQGCDFLNFSMYQRNPIGGTYDQYPAATAATCKLVQLSWVCSRNILGNKANTESVQSAKVVIRKK